MSPIPTLYTPRLTLRPFSAVDASRVEELAGDIRVSATTAWIPHPYPHGAAKAWIETLAPAAEEALHYTFAVTLTGTRTPGREHQPGETGHLIGAVCVRPQPAHASGELGFWIGVPYWNRGFATEACHALLTLAFARLALNRVYAHHFPGNPASGRVMRKLGMVQEGTLHQHCLKDGAYLDVVCYAILHEQWARQRRVPRLVVRQPILEDV